MPRAAVICEFNPFHNGHLFLLEKIKEQYANEIICIMSGNFVQRGDIAVTDKYARTDAALRHGADMVVELPTAYAVSSAQIFARSGVKIARELGCDRLCFGVESDPDLLHEVAAALDDDAVNRLIAEGMQCGLYYPRAVEEAVRASCSDEAASALSYPNNILAIEYIRACAPYGIQPIGIPRQSVSHDSAAPSDHYASASHIRSLITQNADYAAYTPMQVEHPAALSSLESALLYRLKTMPPDEIASLADVSEGLEHRIAQVANEYNSIGEILSHLKTKRYTLSRLRRILIAALLGITRDHQHTPIPYIRVLGVRSSKNHLMRAASLPLIARVRSDYDALDNSTKEIFSLDLRASHAMNIASHNTINEFAQPLIKI